jgi:hypothetical protein
MSLMDRLPDEFDEAAEQQCSRCGERGLYLEVRAGNRYILVDADGAAHSPFCKGRTAEANEFSVLD